MFGVRVVSLSPCVSAKQPVVKVGPIKVGDIVTSIAPNYSLDIPRFNGDDEYRVQAGAQFRIRESARGYYNDSKVFTHALLFSTRHYLLEGIGDSKFTSCYQDSDKRRDESTKAIFIPKNQLNSRFRKV